jgi:hypothetical protein
MRGTPDRVAALMKPHAGKVEAWEVGAAVGNVNVSLRLTFAVAPSR